MSLGIYGNFTARKRVETHQEVSFGAKGHVRELYTLRWSEGKWPIPHELIMRRQPLSARQLAHLGLLPSRSIQYDDVLTQP